MQTSQAPKNKTDHKHGIAKSDRIFTDSICHRDNNCQYLKILRTCEVIPVCTPHPPSCSMRSGNLIYGKDVDTVRPIASITKLMTAMVVLDAGLDLDEKITVTEEDRDHIRMTGSRLQPGATLPRREMLLLALMSSENRAAAALGRTYPGGMQNFVEQMNNKAASLGMQQQPLRRSGGTEWEQRVHRQ